MSDMTSTECQDRAAATLAAKLAATLADRRAVVSCGRQVLDGVRRPIRRPARAGNRVLRELANTWQ